MWICGLRLLKRRPAMTELKSIPLSEFLSLELPSRSYIIDPLLPKGGLMEIYAAAGIGKTTFALSLGLSAAIGQSFMKWGVHKPWNVLYIDGEMADSDMQNRLEAATQSFNVSSKEISNFRLLSRDQCGGVLPDIGTVEGQNRLQPETEVADLIFLDNLSCLMFSGKENDADAWSVVQRWLLTLRAQEKSIVMLHHSGKNGSSRGTSRRHDALDTVIKLDRPSAYNQSDGAKFAVQFEKTRHFFGPEAEPIGLEYCVEGGIACWNEFEITNEKEVEVVKLTTEGMNQVEIASHLGISQGEVSKRLKSARANGLC
jgi:RecA-family ATPase